MKWLLIRATLSSCHMVCYIFVQLKSTPNDMNTNLVMFSFFKKVCEPSLQTFPSRQHTKFIYLFKQRHIPNSRSHPSQPEIPSPQPLLQGSICSPLKVMAAPCLQFRPYWWGLANSVNNLGALLLSPSTLGVSLRHTWIPTLRGSPERSSQFLTQHTLRSRAR